MYRQMVCHSVYAQFSNGGAGDTWDFEAWRTDAPWTTVLNPDYKCQQWGNVADGAAAFAYEIVQGSRDIGPQKAAYLITRDSEGTYFARHILTAKAYGCVKAAGAPGPITVASDFITDETWPGLDLGDEFCGEATSGGGLGGSSSPGGLGLPSGVGGVTLAQGPAAPAGYRYAISLSGFAPNSSVAINCYDSASPNGFYPFSLTTDGSGNASTASYCYSGDGPDHWVIAGGVESNHVTWGAGDGGSTTTPTNPSPPANASISASQGGAYGCDGCYALNIAVHNFPTGTYTYDCHDNSGSGGSDTVFYSHAVSVTDANQSSWPGVFCDDSPPYRAYLVMDGVTSNTVAFAAPAPPPPPPPPTTWTEQETPNHPVNTFANYHNASGQGPAIGAGSYVQVSCKVYDPAIQSVNPDGYWYRIYSSPWNNGYYAPANTFMNGDPYGGPYTHNTDFSVANC